MSHREKKARTDITPETNATFIVENRRKIFQLEHAVLSNSASALYTRDLVMENREAIMRNYMAVFHGNRQLAVSNLEAIFRNRDALFRNLSVGDDTVKKNYRETLRNKSKIDYLDHHSQLNSKLLLYTEELADINTRLIDINRHIMETTEEIVQFNSARIPENKEWIDNGITSLDEATPASNAALIHENKTRIIEIQKRVELNAKKNADMYRLTLENRARIEQNAAEILDTRTKIEQNHAAIQANSDKIAQMISI